MEQVSSMVSNGGGSVTMQRDDEYRNRIMKSKCVIQVEHAVIKDFPSPATHQLSTPASQPTMDINVCLYV